MHFRWANVFGADGWSYSEVLPYFIKSEQQTDPELSKSGNYDAGPEPLQFTIFTQIIFYSRTWNH